METGGCRGDTGRVSPKEQLRRLVEELPDEQVPNALILLQAMIPGPVRTVRHLPGSLGIGDSGRRDVSERVDELLAEGFGR